MLLLLNGGAKKPEGSAATSYAPAAGEAGRLAGPGQAAVVDEEMQSSNELLTPSPHRSSGSSKHLVDDYVIQKEDKLTFAELLRPCLTGDRKASVMVIRDPYMEHHYQRKSSCTSSSERYIFRGGPSALRPVGCTAPYFRPLWAPQKWFMISVKSQTHMLAFGTHVCIIALQKAGKATARRRFHKENDFWESFKIPDVNC